MNAVELADKIKKESPTIVIDDEIYYIVENDRKVADSQLAAYAEAIVASGDPATEDAARVERLVAATDLDGKLIRWMTKATLTWTIDEASFKSNGHPEWIPIAWDICRQATAEWNQAATEQGVAGEISFVEVAAGAQATFPFAFHPFPTNPNLLAVAFFPNSGKHERVVFIGPGTFTNGLYDRVGVIRHELGHVLGFRHEHIRPEAKEGLTEKQKDAMEKWVTGKLGAEALTDFDSQSVMHYPLSNGLGTMKFSLTDKDKSGFGQLYKIPKDAPNLREYPV